MEPNDQLILDEVEAAVALTRAVEELLITHGGFTADEIELLHGDFEGTPVDDLAMEFASVLMEIWPLLLSSTRHHLAVLAGKNSEASQVEEPAAT